MAIRVKTKANVIVSLDKDGLEKLFGLNDAAAETILDGFTEVVSGKAALASAASLTVGLTSIADVRGIYLRVTGAAAVVINGSNTPIQLRPGIVGPATVKAPTAKVLIEGIISSVVVTAGEDLEVSWAAWGDPIT